MTKSIDIIMILIDLGLIMYFYSYAINTTDIAIRLISCLAITMEVFFIIRHVKIMKKYRNTDK